jgi:hypothetical protein
MAIPVQTSLDRLIRPIENKGLIDRLQFWKPKRMEKRSEYYGETFESMAAKAEGYPRRDCFVTIGATAGFQVMISNVPLVR